MNPETDQAYYVIFSSDHRHALKYAIVYAITPTQAREKAAKRFGDGWKLSDSLHETRGMRRVS